MYRMALLAMCSSDTRLDISKYVYNSGSVPGSEAGVNYFPFYRCVMMCLVHDLAEAQGELLGSSELRTGNITAL